MLILYIIGFETNKYTILEKNWPLHGFDGRRFGAASVDTVMTPRTPGKVFRVGGAERAVAGAGANVVPIAFSWLSGSHTNPMSEEEYPSSIPPPAR